MFLNLRSTKTCSQFTSTYRRTSDSIVSVDFLHVITLTTASASLPRAGYSNYCLHYLAHSLTDWIHSTKNALGTLVVADVSSTDPLLFHLLSPAHIISRKYFPPCTAESSYSKRYGNVQKHLLPNLKIHCVAKRCNLFLKSLSGEVINNAGWKLGKTCNGLSIDCLVLVDQLLVVYF